MTTLRELIKLASLDLSDLIIEKDLGLWLQHDFQICPLDFVNFAKEDLSENTTRGFINAITNAKRAVDCQIDSVYQAIGFSHDKQHEATKAFVEWHEHNEGSVDAPKKLKFIRALGLAPTVLISKIRLLRNRLEHYYEVPDVNLVKEYVEIAELFICTVQYKLHLFTSDLMFINADKWSKRLRHTSHCLCFSWKTDEFGYAVTVYNSNNEKITMSIDNNETSYLHLIKLGMSLDSNINAQSVLHGYLNSEGINIPQYSLKVEVVQG